MIDSEINEAVARKLGIDPKAGFAGVATDGSLVFSLPDYCHDIAAAWEIVEKIRAMGYQVIINAGAVGRKEFTISISGDVTKPPYQPLFSEEADTAPMAICLAFLKLQEAPTITPNAR